MMLPAYCIGCEFYKRQERIYCSHPNKDECNNREYYKIEVEDNKGEITTE